MRIFSHRPTVFPYTSHTDFELALWHSTHPSLATHLHQLTASQYRTFYTNFQIYPDLSFRAHLFLQNFHCPSQLFTSHSDIHAHYKHLSTHHTYPFTFSRFYISHQRALELIYKFQKLKLINFAEFWVNTSNTSQILINRVRFSNFLQHLPSITEETSWHLRYQLNNTNAEYDTSNPLVSRFLDFIIDLEHTEFPIHWKKFPENFLPILDPSKPFHLKTFSQAHLIQHFSYSEIDTLLFNFTQLIAPQIDHFPQSFLNTRPPLRTYVPAAF